VNRRNRPARGPCCSSSKDWSCGKASSRGGRGTHSVPSMAERPVRSVLSCRPTPYLQPN
jgi:hypothetical protein